MIVVDEQFPTMGVEGRILTEYPDAVGEAVAREEVAAARARIEALAACLTRFDPGSELCAMNADPAQVVHVSPDLGGAVAAAVRAARDTGGLVDPTLTGELEAAGYTGTRRGMKPLDLDAALRDAPPRAPGGPRADPAWPAVTVSADHRTVERPPGVRIDLGGIGKGLAADEAATLLPRAFRYAVDCGGDLALGGPGAARRPWSVDVRDPRTGRPAHTVRVTAGGVATSGLDIRLWRGPDGRPRHHLLDPATGEPVWPGMIAVTAVAPTALEAEAQAKAAFLRGPAAAEAQLRAGLGGAIAPEEGPVRLVGLRPAPPVVRLKPPG